MDEHLDPVLMSTRGGDKQIVLSGHEYNQNKLSHYQKDKITYEEKSI